MQQVKLYGASDDLIEIEGYICDEVGCFATAKIGVNITASDGTIAKIKYDGEWRIDVKQAGGKLKKKIASVGDTGTHEDEAEGCSSYSDVLIFEEGLQWIKVGRKQFKAE